MEVEVNKMAARRCTGNVHKNKGYKNKQAINLPHSPISTPQGDILKEDPTSQKYKFGTAGHLTLWRQTDDSYRTEEQNCSKSFGAF